MRQATKCKILYSLISILTVFCLAFTAGGTFTTGAGGGEPGGEDTYGPTAISVSANMAHGNTGNAPVFNCLDSDGMQIGETTDEYLGMRWASTGIPQGATITAAELVVDVGYASGSLVSRLFGHDVDTSQDFETDTTVLPSRTQTTAYVDVSLTSQGEKSVSGAGLIAIIQEIVDRPGFTGNITLIFTDSDNPSDSAGCQIDAIGTSCTAENPPTLEITYE